MIKVNIEVGLYNIDELEEDVRDKVLSEHRDFLLSMFDAGEYDWDMDYETYRDNLTEEDIIENINANEYLYYVDGTMAYTIRYTGKHERAGERVFLVNGTVHTEPREYLLNDKENT